MSTLKYKFVFFIPKDFTRTVISHLFKTFPQGLGHIGEYDQVAFISHGSSQYRPSLNAKPAIGTVGKLEHAEEDRVELLVNQGDPDRIRQIIQELKKVHPYEEVGYDVYKLEDF